MIVYGPHDKQTNAASLISMTRIAAPYAGLHFGCRVFHPVASCEADAQRAPRIEMVRELAARAEPGAAR